MFNIRKSILATAILAGTLGLTACGGSSDKKDPVVEPPVNAAPSAPTIDASVINDDATGFVIGTLAATDDSTTALTYSVEDSRFEIVDGKLKLKDNFALNFEQEESDSVTVTVTVSDGALSTSADLTLTIEDVAAEKGVNLYEFDSKFLDGSSVSYSGQIARQSLLNEIKKYIGTLTVENVDANTITAAQVESHLNALFADYEAIAENEFTFVDPTNYKQKTFADISSSGKSLSGKIAGNDGSKQTKDWLVEGTFVGWNDFGTEAKTPEGLVKHIFSMLVAQVQKHNDGEVIEDPAGNTITKLFVTPEGIDLQQLVQKHVLGAVMFSQGTDDYLEDGLLADNTKQDKDTKPYTSLEHQFDEGFGYFGATRDYLEYSDDEIAGKGGRDDYQGKHDSDDDALIDLNSEFIFGNSANAAKRDRGTKSSVNPTDFSASAMNAFIAGRKIINDAVPNALSEEQVAAVEAQRDMAVANWEKAIAATVVHYINDVINDDSGDIDDIATGSYSASQFAAFTKHWAEMKGFALNFQFSPFSPVTEENFAKIHQLFGEKPVIVQADIEAYKTSLLEARQLIQDAYDFDAENVTNW
jgi:hypothetical protein